MAELLQLEFNAPGAAEMYQKVSQAIGVDHEARTGYPKGMLSHVVGVDADGHHLVVNEVWNSKQDQESFLANRLGPALADAGVGNPSRLEWFSVISNNQLG